MSRRPQSEVANINFDAPVRDGEPQHGDYLVSVGVRGVGSVYQVTAVAPVLNRRIAKYLRVWKLTCLRAPDMKSLVTILRGRPVIPNERVWWLVWHPRKAKERHALQP